MHVNVLSDEAGKHHNPTSLPRMRADMGANFHRSFQKG